MTARDLACAAFWSLRHPFNAFARQRLGRCFTLAQLITLAESLAPAELHRYLGGSAETE